MKESFATLFFKDESDRNKSAVRRIIVGVLDHGHTDPGKDFLSVDELTVFAGFKAERRRVQFLAGRYIAKATVRQEHPEIAPQIINIVNGVWGFPLIHAPSLYQTTISISHTVGCGAALFSPSNTHPLGLDVEAIDENNLSPLGRFLSADEQSLVVLAGMPLLEGMHLLWSAKEAAGKALKVGFAVPEEIYTISSLSLSNNIYHIFFDKLPMLKVAGWLHGNLTVCAAFPSVWSLMEIKKGVVP